MAARHCVQVLRVLHRHLTYIHSHKTSVSKDNKSNDDNDDDDDNDDEDGNDDDDNDW